MVLGESQDSADLTSAWGVLCGQAYAPRRAIGGSWILGIIIELADYKTIAFPVVMTE
jgi:hypothetical protein